MENNFGQNISNLLEIYNISQRELARRAGVTENSIGRYIRGERTPKIDIAIKIAEALSVSLNELFDDNQTEKDLEMEYDMVRYSIKSNAKNWTNDQKAKLVDLLFDLK